MIWQLGWFDRLDIPLFPQRDNCRRLKQGILGCCQEKAIPLAAWPPSASPHSLEEVGYGGRRVDLNHAVQIANVNPKLQDTGGDDYAVVPSRKRSFGFVTLLRTQGAMGNKSGDIEPANMHGKFLGLGPAVQEHEPFLPAMKPGDHGRGIFQRAHEVERDLRLTGCGL